MAPLDLTSTAALLVILLLTLVWTRRRAAGPLRARHEEPLDTLQSWPPQAVRIMTLPERKAYEVLRKALPGRLLLSQVPLARFISVPTQHAYSQWLQRVGRLNVDLLVCDFSSRVIAAVEIRPQDQTARSIKRHERLADVLRAAGIEVHIWREDALPSIAEVRKLFATRSADEEAEEAMAVDPDGRRRLPVPDMQELLATGDGAEYHQHDPVPSGYFDDFDAAASQPTSTH